MWLLLILVVLALALGAMAMGGRRKRTWITAALATVALLVLNFLLLGLPGGFLVWLSTRLVLGRDGFRDIAPDAGWPLALAASFFPLIIVPTAWLVTRARPAWSGWAATLAVAGVTFVGAIILSLVLYGLAPHGRPGQQPGFWSASAT